MGIRFIRERFNQQVIRKKMLFIYIPLVILPLLALGIISNLMYSKSIIDKTIKNAYDESTLITIRFESVIGQAESFATLFTTGVNNLFQLQRLEADNSDVSNLKLKNQIRNELSFLQLSFPDVESAFYLDKSLMMVSTDIKLEKDMEDPLQHPMIQIADEHRSLNAWFPMQRRQEFVSDPEKPVVTLGKRIIEINSGELRGYLIVNINTNAFSKIFDLLNNDKERLYRLIDEEGNIIATERDEELLHAYQPERIKNFLLESNDFSEIKKVNGQEILITAMTYEKFGWKIVQELPVKELMAEVHSMEFIILIIGLICLCLTLWGAQLLSRLIVHPILELKNSMQKVEEGRLNEFSNIKTNDEIGQLAVGFNGMIERIKELIANVKFEQRQKREYEFALIQAQIKPHFLYNTLDLIYVLSDMGRNVESCIATKALADYYRIVLSNGKEIISIEEEIKNVESYLTIQQARYSDVFEYIICVDDDIRHCKIPKLVLQPLVENSIYHGLRQKASKGKITITGKIEGNHIMLIIADDGIGIAPDLLEQLRKKQDQSESSSGFGLRSVDERIKLYFGANYGAIIQSGQGAGTQIIVNIPMTQGSEEIYA